jgi:hypothetical protein
MPLTRGISPSILRFSVFTLVLFAVSGHALLRGLETEQARAWARAAALSGNISATLTIKGTAHTVVADDFKNPCQIETLVNADDGRVYKVDTPEGEEYFGERVTWEVASPIGMPAAAAPSTKTGEGAEGSSATLSSSSSAEDTRRSVGC